jgi:hypothetical protein
MPENITAPEPPQVGQVANAATRGAAASTALYLHQVVIADGCCELAAVAPAGARDSRFIGVAAPRNRVGVR